jgi:hypothetical protein
VIQRTRATILIAVHSPERRRAKQSDSVVSLRVRPRPRPCLYVRPHAQGNRNCDLRAARRRDERDLPGNLPRKVITSPRTPRLRGASCELACTPSHPSCRVRALMEYSRYEEIASSGAMRWQCLLCHCCAGRF